MDLDNHSALLASGARVSLVSASVVLLLLDRMLNGTMATRNLVIRLREACLTENVIPEAILSKLTEEGFATSNGEINPLVKEIVRTAVRGEGSDLHLVTPFVSPWDRALSDFVISREKIRGGLPPEQAEPLIAARLLPPEKPGISWLDYIRKRHGTDPEMPPFSHN
jgi:hypothetical protein